MRQYFVEQALTVGQNVAFTDEIIHHVKDVLRMSTGDKIRIVDTNSKVFYVVLTIDRSDVYGTVMEEIDINSNRKEIIYCAAMIKKDKWELLLQKATELGATKIVPLVTSRTIIQLEEKEVNKKLERWNKIVLEAAQQCNRADLCHVERPIKLKQIQQYMSESNFVAYENETGNYLYNVLEKDKSVTFITGPEGGLSVDEVNYLTNLGFTTCSLGERILRAETAGMYFLTVIDAKRNSL